MKIVISQPMFLPWVGLFEQIKLCDTFIFYDDVQLPQGRSLLNRVQIKTQRGIQWLTAPILRKGKGLQAINSVQLDDSQNWREKHLQNLRTYYSRSPFFEDMMNLAEVIYTFKTSFLAEFNIFAIKSVIDYFEIKKNFALSSCYPSPNHSSAHLIELCQIFNANIYITGHGAKHYLDHDLFELVGIRVEYIDYQRNPYPQLFGAFDPHVTILDLIANMGRQSSNCLCSKSKYWRDYFNGYF